MLEALSDLAGGPLPSWAWLVAWVFYEPIPILWQPSLDLWINQGNWLPESLDWFLAPRIPLLDLAKVAGSEDWSTVADVDVPNHQCHLSTAIDQAVFNELCSQASDSRFEDLGRSSAILHAGDWLNVVPSHVL